VVLYKQSFMIANQISICHSAAVNFLSRAGDWWWLPRYFFGEAAIKARSMRANRGTDPSGITLQAQRTFPEGACSRFRKNPKGAGLAPAPEKFDP
jgi:hypothetical protein